jgi:hypothetical protein
MAPQAATSSGQPIPRKLISALLAISFGTILEWVSLLFFRINLFVCLNASMVTHIST